MLYYIKGVDFIMKYVMFGFEKVKNDKLPDNFAYLMTFVTDLENVLLSLLLFFAIFYLLWFFAILVENGQNRRGNISVDSKK